MSEDNDILRAISIGKKQKILDHDHSNLTRENLSPYLIEQQNRSEEDVDAIMEIHNELDKVFDEMVAADPSDTKRLHDLATVVTEIEFRLQEAWGFERNADMHSWWFRVPHCKCPYLDNLDLIGTELAIRQSNCPVHGSVEN